MTGLGIGAPPGAQDLAREHGVMRQLGGMLRFGSPPAVAAAAGALQKMCTRHEANQTDAVNNKVVEALVRVAWGEEGKVRGADRLRSGAWGVGADVRPKPFFMGSWFSRMLGFLGFMVLYVLFSGFTRRIFVRIQVSRF